MTEQPLVHSRTILVLIHTINPIPKRFPVTPSEDRHEVARENLKEIRKTHPDAYAEIITTELMA